MQKLISKIIRLLTMIAGVCMAFSLDGACHSTTAAPKISYESAKVGHSRCLSAKEAQLFRLVNTYRKSNGLPPLVDSKSLNKVAWIHAMDLYRNDPAGKTDDLGAQCSLHSWSGQGYWTPVCITQTHTRRSAEKMWSKPGEITEHVYNGIGYENAYWTSDKEVSVRRVLEAWKSSPSHNALILESGIWKGIRFAALGVGIYMNYAVMWVSTLPDPQGSTMPCK